MKFLKKNVKELTTVGDQLKLVIVITVIPLVLIYGLAFLVAKFDDIISVVKSFFIGFKKGFFKKKKYYSPDLENEFED